MDLVTLDQAKMQLRIEDSLHDADIQMKIAQASAIVVDYLKYETVPPEDWLTGSPPVVDVPELIQAATLLVISELYNNRETSTVNVISNAFVALLDRQRDPALA